MNSFTFCTDRTFLIIILICKCLYYDMLMVSLVKELRCLLICGIRDWLKNQESGIQVVTVAKR